MLDAHLHFHVDCVGYLVVGEISQSSDWQNDGLQFWSELWLVAQ